MAVTNLTCDYLIIGCGAVGMAFADVLLSETNASIIMVDKHHKPGGHWNDAYSFVNLHQPSKFYGVSSRELSRGYKDSVGLNKGLHELASGAEVLNYFDTVMKQTFLPSGRVQYFPMCEYKGDGKFSSILSDNEFCVTVNKKTVDATYFKTSVPSTHIPNYQIDQDVELSPLNVLPRLNSKRDHYVVIGGGKTGMDACLWLLYNQVNPDRIQWVMPRDGWLIDRKNTQPTREFFTHVGAAQAAQIEAIAEANSLDDLFKRLENSGALLRLDKNVKPTMYHAATISQAELKQLQKIKNIVRKGRIKRISKNQIHFTNESVSIPDNTLYIDCSARAVPITGTFPIFADKHITIQTVRTIQPVFSAAFIAHIEATYDDDAKKNALCPPISIPNNDTDWLITTALQMQNQLIWSKEPGIRDWLINNRLDGFTQLFQKTDDSTEEELVILERIKQSVPKAAENLPRLINEIMKAA